MGSTKLGGGSLLYAGEVDTYNGPWATPDDMRKFNGMLRYSQGTATDGFSVTGMAYSNTWNSTDQVPLRAITSGLIGLYGELDPTDGGDTSRFSLSGDSANRRSRVVEGQCLFGQIRARSVQQLHLVPDQSGSRRPIPSARRSRLWRRQCSRTINGTCSACRPRPRSAFRSRYDDIDARL